MSRRIKIVQVSAQSGGSFDDYDIQTPLNKRLSALQKANKIIKKITYITNDRTGDITGAIVEYYEERK